MTNDWLISGSYPPGEFNSCAFPSSPGSLRLSQSLHHSAWHILRSQFSPPLESKGGWFQDTPASDTKIHGP